MSKLSTLKRKWLRDPAIKKAYNAAKPEYDLAKKLIVERLKAHLTQKEVAKKMQTTQSVIARLESGTQRPSFKTMENYAKAIGKRIEIQFRDIA
ncbi:MAG: helix-turn-helix transcriptional regulator [Proteobacteria bacterium]|nr:helix-turn-helix transcriptional regulator [Pseudomonadota bacterium]